MANPDPQPQQRRPAAAAALAVAALATLVALTATTAHAQAAPPTDKYTLAFLNKLAAEFSVLRPTWTADNYCSRTWLGVECHATTGAVTVNLDMAGLEGQLPDVDRDDAASVNVELIDLKDNQGLHGPFPSSWGNLSQLRYLYLDSTQLRGALPDEWNGMTSLVLLSIFDAQVCGPLPRWTLPSLSQLDLRVNRIGGSLPREWASMPSLTDLWLKDNNFCGCAPSEFANNTALMAALASDAPAVLAEDCATANKCEDGSDLCNDGDAASPAATTAVPFAISAVAAVVAIAVGTGVW